MIWYDLTPQAYATSLRYNADRSDESAAYQDTSKEAWAPREAAALRRQSRRLRAMAMLCERSTATRAGDVDMRGLSDPTTSREVEGAVVETIEKEAEAASHGWVLTTRPDGPPQWVRGAVSTDRHHNGFIYAESLDEALANPPRMEDETR